MKDKLKAIISVMMFRALVWIAGKFYPVAIVHIKAGTGQIAAIHFGVTELDINIATREYIELLDSKAEVPTVSELP